MSHAARHRETQQAHLALAAREQHGVFTRQQARAAGMTDRMINWRVASGEWERVDFGAYRLLGTPPTWRQRLAAACLVGPAVASHAAAAQLWRFPGFEGDAIEVVALRHRRRHAADVIWHESQVLRPGDVTTIDSIAVTSALRTILDLASSVPEIRLEEAFDDAVRRGLASISAAYRDLERLGSRRRGFGAMRRVLARRSAEERPPESVLETRFLRLTDGSSLPRPVPQVEVRDGERLVARVDFGYPDRRLAIEIDGLRFHAGRRAHQHDVARQNRIVTLGWCVLRFTAEDLSERPDAVIGAIEQALSLTSSHTA